MQYMEMLYRLAVGLWAGGNAIFTLMLTPILFKTEARDTAARIVGNLFPGYFKWGVACGVIALVCRLATRKLHPAASTDAVTQPISNGRAASCFQMTMVMTTVPPANMTTDTHRIHRIMLWIRKL